MNGGGTAIPEVHALLATLAVGKRCAEAGTAFGEGAAAMAATARSVVTVELDEERAALARERLRDFAHVALVVGDWHAELPPRAPFDLLFLDGGGFKQEPEKEGPLALALLAPGGMPWSTTSPRAGATTTPPASSCSDIPASRRPRS